MTFTQASNYHKPNALQISISYSSQEARGTLIENSLPVGRDTGRNEETLSYDILCEISFIAESSSDILCEEWGASSHSESVWATPKTGVGMPQGNCGKSSTDHLKL